MYDENSFIQGIAVGRAMKGVEYDGGSSVPDTYDGGCTIINAPFIVDFAPTWESYLVPTPIVCTWGVA